MKFLKIELENIFAYWGPVELDLSMTTPERNIILVWGRNGMGKTSLLKALKHLFLGIADEDDRRVGFPPKPLAPGQYVLGDGKGWSGLVNQIAYENARRHQRQTTARVMALWEDGDGHRISAERRWTITDGLFAESLVVVDGGERFTANAAEERLQDFVPREFVKFFFFDGEDIKSLAETEERKQIDFDRLLRITFITSLSDELVKVATERRRRGMRDELRRQIDDAVAALSRARRQLADATVQITEIDEELVVDALDLRRFQTRRDNLATGASEAQRAALEGRRREVVAELGHARERIAENIPEAAPMLANPRLVAAALAAVEARLKSASAAETVVVRRIGEEVAAWVEGSSAELNARQIEVLVLELRARLKAFEKVDVGPSLFADLDIGRAERLRMALLRWSIVGPDRLDAQAAELAHAQQLRAELERVDEALMHIAVGSQSNLEQYRSVSSAIVAIEERAADLNQRKGQQSLRRDLAVAETASLETSLKSLEANQDLATREAAEAKFINRVVLALNELREALRAATREDLAVLINQRFRQIASHPLIDRIEIDESYTLSFLSDDGRPIGRASLSSGLKQLAATSLLWAMKDAAAEEMPVVIDTPLGRIDRENQNNMLHNYYPNLSHQVIVLPTNAEIDERKLGILQDRVAWQYTIVNETGQSAKIESRSLWGERA